MWSTTTSDRWQVSHVDVEVDVERSSPESVSSVTAQGASGGEEIDSPPPSHIPPPPRKEREVKGHDVITPSVDKPSLSYIALISGVIMAAPGERILLNDIYSAIMTKYPYYALTKDKAWKNSIRHNLSLNECFIKSGRADNGKGNYWAVHPACLGDFRKGDFRRRQARRKSKRCTKMADGCGADTGYVDYRTLTLPYRYNVGYAHMSRVPAGPTPTGYQPLTTQYVVPTASQSSATSSPTMTSLAPTSSYQYSLTSYAGYLQAHSATATAPPNVNTRQLGSSYGAPLSVQRASELTVSQRSLSQIYDSTPSLYPNSSGFYQNSPLTKDRNLLFR